MLDLRRIKPRSGKNRFFVAPAIAIHGEPDRDSPVFALPARELADALLAIARGEPRTRLIDRTNDGLAMQFVQRSAVFRLPDTIDVEVIAFGASQSSLAIYSRSRYGRRDFGVNRRRIERWLAALAARVGAGKIVQPENVASPPSA